MFVLASFNSNIFILSAFILLDLVNPDFFFPVFPYEFSTCESVSMAIHDQTRSP